MSDPAPKASVLPPACVHVDVDGWWAIRQCYGDKEAAAGDPDRAYEEGLPALHELFGELQVPAEFFVVGADAQISSKARQLAVLAQNFSIENHSYSHPLKLGALPRKEIEREVDKAHQSITEATGREPIGFRAPGYTASQNLWRILNERGYKYDSSILPTWSGPLLRLVDAWISGALPKRHQYGPIRRVFAPQTPYFPLTSQGEGNLQEIPVLVSAPWRLPLQAGMLFSRGLAPLETTLKRLSDRKEPIIFLLHAIDAVDTSDGRHPLPSWRGARFFTLNQTEKLKRLKVMIRLLKKYRRITSMKELAGCRGSFPS